MNTNARPSLAIRLLATGCLAALGATVGAPAQATPVMGPPTVSKPSPQPLGTTVTITANATDTDPGTITYRFQIGFVGSAKLRLVADYSVNNTFVFTPELNDGVYQFVVTARNNSTGNVTTSKVARYQFTALAVNGIPVVNATSNPLVALYSSPPCASGGKMMRVSVLRPGSLAPFDTNSQSCIAGHDLNFIIAGMRSGTTYRLTGQTWNGTSWVNSSPVDFTTGVPPITFPIPTFPVPFSTSDSSAERFVLMSMTNPTPPMALDVEGNPVWYYLDPSGVVPTLTRPIAGGDILMISNGSNSLGSSVVSQQIVKEIDLAGNIVRETNASRVAEQVVAMAGATSSCQLGSTECLVGAFHHEALRLPNGHTLMLATEERIYTDGTQGSSASNPVDILGDVIVDVDQNMQVAWYWRAFDHIDVNRAAILGETCKNGQGGCPPIFLTTGSANDWLHGNALFYASADGSILFSMRHQDWIAKIDYGNGTGTGNVVWLLGKDGNFAINSTDAYPWFSHQHDPGGLSNGTSTLVMFDNGNTRVSPPPLGLGYGDSRGYVIQLDTTNMVATPTLLADLGYFSEALGTAEPLANGDWHWEAGFAAVTPPYSQSIETTSTGTIDYAMQLSNLCYRAFRMQSLYTEPAKD